VSLKAFSYFPDHFRAQKKKPKRIYRSFPFFSDFRCKFFICLQYIIHLKRGGLITSCLQHFRVKNLKRVQKEAAEPLRRTSTLNTKLNPKEAAEPLRRTSTLNTKLNPKPNQDEHVGHVCLFCEHWPRCCWHRLGAGEEGRWTLGATAQRRHRCTLTINERMWVRRCNTEERGGVISGLFKCDPG